MPVVIGAISLMPAPVIGAGLIYTACFLIGSGIQLVQSRMMDARRTFTIGLAIIGGVGVEIVPFDFSQAPVWVELLVGNSLAFATFLAVTLNILLSLGVSSSARLVLSLEGTIRERILQFMERNGALWGAPSDVVQRAAPAVTEWCEELRSISTCERVNVDMRFDEFSLTILIVPESFTHPQAGRDRPASLLQAVASHIQSRYEARVIIGDEDTLPSARLEFVH